MPIHYRSMLTLKYKDLIDEKFNFLVNFFDFEPGDIFIEILPLEYFDKFYELERGKKPEFFVVGSALNNGRIIILDKEDFEKREGHTESEFEDVILHEMAHMFIRRIMWPKHAYIWIQEGICEYLSFGKKGFKVKKFISFDKIETEEGWDKYNPYQQAGAFFQYLAKKYGENKIPQFVKLLKIKENQKEVFEEVFGNLIQEQESFKETLVNETIA